MEVIDIKSWYWMRLPKERKGTDKEKRSRTVPCQVEEKEPAKMYKGEPGEE